MTTKHQVLKYLISNSNEYISGQRLANELGKTRASVWKAIKSLQAEGYEIDAVTNKGYRINDKNDILNKDILACSLDSQLSVFYYPSIDSTNNEAKRLIAQGNNDNLLVVAEEQTAGRGRQGKSFYSPALTGIYFSVVTHPMAELQNAVTSTTVAAVAVCRAIEKLTDRKPKIKWVNDVYLDDKKICGILTEAVTDFESQTVTSVIVGIGMNINTVSFPKEVENAGAIGENIRRADLICAVVNELIRISNGSWEEVISYYRSHSMLIGESINFIQNGKVTPATVLSIDEQGGLVLKTENAEQITLRSGEISIRKRNANE